MKELIYTIDKPSSDKDDVLVIKIQVAKREAFTFIPIEIQPPLTQEILPTFLTPKDTSLISFLIKEEAVYLKKTLGRTIDRKLTSLVHIHISPQETLNLWKLFAISGKLYYEKTPIVIDLYTKVELYYKSETLDKNHKTESLIKIGSEEFPLSSCTFLGRGPPHFFIRGMQLKLISTAISWKDLKHAYMNKYRSVEELLQESTEDSEAPKVLLSGEDLKVFSIDPLPVLVLKDRLGAFAELKMDYEGELISFHEITTQASPIKRDLKLERHWEKDLLETDYLKKTVGSSQYYCPLDKVAKSIAFLIELGWTVKDWRGNKVLKQQAITLNAETSDSTIIIKGKIDYGVFQADLKVIIGSFNRRDRFAEIAPGHVALLPDNWNGSQLEGIADQGEIVAEGVSLRKNQIGTLASFFEKKSTIQFSPDLSILKEKIDSFEKMETKHVGKGFKGTLRCYQQEGLNWLSFLYDFGFHGILADDMGLGKTIQVIAFLSSLITERPTLILVPTSLIFNWKKEFERFLPGTPILIHHGNIRCKTALELSQAKIIITTYTTMRLDIDLLSQISYSCLFLDEAQAIKNAKTQTAQIAASLNSSFRLSITGTPIENNMMELWSHFKFLMPDLFGDEKEFQAEIQAGMSDPRFHKRIKQKIRPFLLRRKKEEVAKDLPEKIEQTVWIEMGEKQRLFYESFLTGIKRGLINKIAIEGVSKYRMQVFEAIMRLRQICCHPLLAPHQNLLEPPKESEKLEVLFQDLEIIKQENKKVLVYSQFTSMLSIIKKRMLENSWSFTYLDGSTLNREKVVDTFQEDSSIHFFLISLKAGGVGLNLTAADYVFLYDPWWNNAIENQAIDRAHRIGRKESVIAKRYVMAESIEEKMMTLKSAKHHLANEMLDEGEFIETLSSEDLLFLLK